MADDESTRRRVLKTAGIVGSFGLTGCLRLSQNQDAGSGTTPTEDGTTGGTPTAASGGGTETSTRTGGPTRTGTQTATETRTERPATQTETPTRTRTERQATQTETPTTQTETAEVEFTSVTGRVRSEAGTSLDRKRLQIVADPPGRQRPSFRSPVITDSAFASSVPAGSTLTITYEHQLDQYITEFDGVPILYDLVDGVSVSGETEDLGTYTIPEAYRTEIQFVDSDGNPVEGLPASFRTPGGSGMGPDHLTTDSDGYVKFQYADTTGVELVGRYTVELESPDGGGGDAMQIITVTEESEFTVTVPNPGNYK